MKYIIHNRIQYYEQTTLGILVLNDSRFCYTLEDTVRAKGIKVYAHTAIPANDNTGYKVGIRTSSSFERDVLVLYTESDGYTLEYNGISFEYIYSHGGNNHINTKGCILVAYNRDGNKIYNSAEQDLFNIVKEWLDDDEEVRWVVHNFKQEE